MKTEKPAAEVPGGTPVERSTRPWERCREHGPAAAGVWACPTCLVDLRRWKSTHAPRLAALEGLLHAAQKEAHDGREAMATLASERAANALLTGRVQWLENALEHIAGSCGGRAAEVARAGLAQKA